MFDEEPIYDLGGTFRAWPAERTIARARRHFLDFGITRIANVTGLDHVGVPVWIVVRPLAKSLTVSQGKGKTDELAVASGLMESIELFHAEQFVPRGHLARIDNVFKLQKYINVLSLPVRNDADLSGRTELEWIEATSLSGQESRWIPREILDLDFTKRHSPTFVSSSNGLASGNTFAEAVLHGLCEVIERDQLSLWLARESLGSKPTATRLRLDSINDLYCERLLEACWRARLEVFIWYVTVDLDVPVFSCSILDAGKTLFPLRSSGNGCHPRKNVALSRAITEALQSRLTIISGSRDDLYWSRYRLEIPASSETTLLWSDRIRNEPESLRYEEISEFGSVTKAGTTMQQLGRMLAARGLEEVLVVDLTRKDIGIPVVYIVVPGLEGDVRRPLYTPGTRMVELIGSLT